MREISSLFFAHARSIKVATGISIQAIRKHLRENGRNHMLMKSMVGRDPLGRYPSIGVWMNDGEEYFNAKYVFDDAEEETKYKEYLNPFHDI